MAAIMYFERLGKLKPEKGFATGTDLADIEFYVAKNKNPRITDQVFLIMTDDKGMRDVVELEYKGPAANPTYNIYKVSLRQPVRLVSGMITLQLMALAPGSSDYNLSTEFSISLTAEHYEIARQIYLTKALGAQVQGYYTEIVELFQQLIRIEKGE